MQKLLVLASTYPRWPRDHEPGFVHELSRRLSHTFEVHVLCPHAPGALLHEMMDGVHVHRFRYAPAALETLVQNGGILNNLKHRKWKWLLVPCFLAGLVLESISQIRRLKPDVLHVHWIIPQGLAITITNLFTRIPPYLLTSHGGDLFGLRGALLTHLKMRIIRDAAAISVVSSPMAQLAMNLGAKPDQLHVIPMGVDFNHLFTPSNNTERLPNEILFVGRLVEKKGMKYLFMAMPAILDRIPSAHLTVVGYGPEEPALRMLAEELKISGKIKFAGAVPQPDLPNYYRSASLFAAPFIEATSGDQEGLPVALMEAIACECPVVAGNLDVMRDLFDSEERASMLVQANNTFLLAERIITALSQPAESLQGAMRLRERLMQHLNWDSIADQYAETLIKLASQNNTPGVQVHE
jgi:glycosyltransferase involved in cell wall biosynthesis